MKAILFDLDGTLLPMNEDQFVKGYFGRLFKFLMPHVYDDKHKFVASVWYGTKAMRMNENVL